MCLCCCYACVQNQPNGKHKVNLLLNNIKVFHPKNLEQHSRSYKRIKNVQLFTVVKMTMMFQKKFHCANISAILEQNS